MILSDVQNARDLAILQFLLTQEECSSVTVNCPNCDFEGPDQRVDHEDGNGVLWTEFGSTVTACLAQIVTRRLESSDRQWFETAVKHLAILIPDVRQEVDRILIVG